MNYIQSGGVLVSGTTLHQLADLPAPFPEQLLPPALLVLNDNCARPSPWPDRLRARGSVVETIPFDGFAAFVRRDEFQVEPPALVLRRVTAYLADAVGAVESSSCPPTVSPATLRLDGATETPINFGPGRGMFGILCNPDKPAFNIPAVLLPTTGIDPCSGMSRMWTDLARNLAQCGITRSALTCQELARARAA